MRICDRCGVAWRFEHIGFLSVRGPREAPRERRTITVRQKICRDCIDELKVWVLRKEPTLHGIFDPPGDEPTLLVRFFQVMSEVLMEYLVRARPWEKK